MESRFRAPDIECDGCANAIKNALGRISGVSAVDVDVDAKTVMVTYEQPANQTAVVEALDRAGFPAQPA